MDGYKTFSKPTNVETEINLRKPSNYKGVVFEETNDNIDTGTQNYKNIENTPQEEPRENVLHNLLSSCNVSFHQLCENNELAGVGDKANNKIPSTSKYFEQKSLNVPVKDISSKNVICENTVKLDWALLKEIRQSDLQPYQSNKQITLNVSSTCGPRLLANGKKGFNAFSNNQNDYSFGSNVAIEKLLFDCDGKKAIITLQLPTQHCLPIYNLGGLFINSYKRPSGFVQHENSSEIDQFMLPSQLNMYTSWKSKVSLGEVRESLNSKSFIKPYLFGDQKFCNQLSSKLGSIVIAKECLQKSALDSAAKYSLNNSTENILSISNTNELLVYPETCVDKKEKSNIALNQINNLCFQLFEKYKEPVRVLTEKSISNSTDEFLKIQSYIMSNNLGFGFNCNKVTDSIVVGDAVSKHLPKSSDEANLPRKICHGSNLTSKELFNLETNLNLAETSCTMNLFNQLSKNLSHESAKSSQALMNHKFLVNDTIITNITASKYIEVNETRISASQNEINKVTIDFGLTQLENFEAMNISHNYSGKSEHVYIQRLKLEPNRKFKLSDQNFLKLKTNSFPQLESYTGFGGSEDAILRCQRLKKQRIIHCPSLKATAENVLESKLLSRSNSNFKFQQSLEGVDKFFDNSFIQSEFYKNMLCNSSKDNTNIKVSGKLASKQQLFETLSVTNTYVDNESCKQLIEPTYSALLSHQLLEGDRKHLSSKTGPEKPMINPKTNDLKRKLALTFSNKKQGEKFEKVELCDALNSNNLGKIELSTSSSTDKLTNNTNDSNKTILDETFQFDGETLDAVDFDAYIDKAIDESIDKYDKFMCDKEILATPDTSDKGSQTDKIISNERKTSCKRCLNFEGEDFSPSKRTKAYHKINNDSTLSNIEQVDTISVTKLLSYEIKPGSSSNITWSNENGTSTGRYSNYIDDVIRTNNNMVQTNLKDISPTINQNMKSSVNMDSLFCESSNVNNEFSLYDEDMDIEAGNNWLKESRDKYEDECVLSDHKVPVVDEGKVAETALITSPSSFKNTPKKPILKVGLSRSARLKPLHQK